MCIMEGLKLWVRSDAGLNSKGLSGLPVGSIWVRSKVKQLILSN